MDTKKQTTTETTAAEFARIFTGLGAPAAAVPYMVAQTAYETGDFKSKLLKDHNNASGIVWTGKATQKNAIKGRPLPEDPRYFYAKFDTLQDWARDYIRVLNLKTKPIQATTPEDFVKRLKANGYFSAPLEQYKKGFDKYLTKYGKIAAPSIGIIVLLIGAAYLFLLK
jgi:hypothetical protein